MTFIRDYDDENNDNKMKKNPIVETSTYRSDDDELNIGDSTVTTVDCDSSNKLYENNQYSSGDANEKRMKVVDTNSKSVQSTKSSTNPETISSTLSLSLVTTNDKDDNNIDNNSDNDIRNDSLPIENSAYIDSSSSIVSDQIYVFLSSSSSNRLNSPHYKDQIMMRHELRDRTLLLSLSAATTTNTSTYEKTKDSNQIFTNNKPSLEGVNNNEHSMEEIGTTTSSYPNLESYHTNKGAPNESNQQIRIFRIVGFGNDSTSSISESSNGESSNDYNNGDIAPTVSERSETNNDAFIVEAIPVQSMILVTAEIVDNNNIENNNLRTNDENSIDNVHEQALFVNGEDSVRTIKISINDDNSKNPTGRSKRRNRKYLIFSIVSICGTLVLIVYLRGWVCFGDECSKEKQYNPSSLTMLSSFPTQAPSVHATKLSIQPRRAFKNRDELLIAVDDYLQRTKKFDSLINKYGTMDNWDVSAISNFYEVFSSDRNKKVYDFNEDLSQWNMSLANDTSFMFVGASKFNSDLSRWDVGNVKFMTSMFAGAVNFNSNLSRWNVSSVQDMTQMFENAESFTSDLSKWDVSLVSSFDGMFTNAISFTSDLSGWDVGSGNNFANMFSGATNFTSDLSNWNMTNVWTLDGFVQRTKYFNTNVAKWNVAEVTSFAYAFAFAESFTGDGVEEWDVSNGSGFDYMFNGAPLFDADLSKWNTSNARTMSFMFAQTNSFQGHGLEHWDVSRVFMASNMFERAVAFDCDVSQWDMSQALELSGMFAQTTRFCGIGLETWNLSETVYITGMFGMFCDAQALNQSYISKLWNTSVDTIDCQPEFFYFR